MAIDLFEFWERKPTNTETLVSLLIEQGFDISKPNEFRDIYRIQPKITGCERRSALCYWNRSSCDDMWPTYKHRKYTGIDLLAPVSELVKKGIEIVTEGTDDPYIWVCSKK